MLAHGGRILPAVTVDTYNEEMRDEEGFVLIVVNSHTEVVPFTLPEAVGGSRWVRLIDSSDPNGEPLALRDFGHAYDVPTRALLLFVLQPTRTRDRARGSDDGRCLDAVGAVWLRLKLGHDNVATRKPAERSLA